MNGRSQYKSKKIQTKGTLTYIFRNVAPLKPRQNKAATLVRHFYINTMTASFSWKGSHFLVVCEPTLFSSARPACQDQLSRLSFIQWSSRKASRRFPFFDCA